MIISDLSYLKSANEVAVVGGFTVTNPRFSESFYLSKYISSNVYVYGHAATVESDATAYGTGTVTQVFTNSNTTPYSSSSSGTSISASSGFYYYH